MVESNYALATWESLKKLRALSPLVHNVTNYVVMNNTANALLAIGASPAMVHAVEEVEEFVSLASSLVINIGTLSPPWIAGMRLAAARAKASGKPWAFDPVGAGATALRTRVSRELLEIGPSAVRGNASEILALASTIQRRTRGVDSTDPSLAALTPARDLARTYDCVVVVSGPVDYVTDGDRTLEVHNGHTMMTRVTGLGCTATALVGAFLAVERDALAASAQAMAVLGIAGEMAALKSAGPGSLQMNLLDTLYKLDRASIVARTSIKPRD